MGEFITVANGTDTRARYGACPTALDTLNMILRQPLKWSLPHFTFLIGVCSSQGSRRKPRPRRLFLGINYREAIMESDIGNNGVQCGRLDRLEARPILFKDGCIPTMEGVEKKHDQ